MVNMGCRGECRAVIDDMTGERLRFMAACECLVEGGGLDNSLVGKLGGGWRHNGKSGRRSLLGTSGPGTEEIGLRWFHPIWSVAFGRPLQSGLDDRSLLFADGHTPLQLLLSHGIVRLKTGGQTCQAHVVHVVPGGHWTACSTH
jgi:hypothetical protein